MADNLDLSQFVMGKEATAQPVPPPQPAQPQPANQSPLSLDQFIMGKGVQLSPQTQAALTNAGGIQNVNVVKFPETPAEPAEVGYKRRFEQPGVPLDLHDEVGPLISLMTSFRTEKEDKIKYLQRVFGDANVRADDRGDPIIRITDPQTKKQKDVPLNAWGMSVNDLVQVASAIPEMLGAAASIKAGKGIPKLGTVTKAGGFLRDALAGAVGMETVGTAEDIATKWADKQPKSVGDIIENRAAKIPEDVVASYALGGVGKIAQWLKNTAGWIGKVRSGSIPVPFDLKSLRTPLQVGGLESQRYIADKTGINIPLSAAETSGIPFIAQLWEYLRKYPSAARVIAKFEEKKDASKKLFQEYLLEPMDTETDEKVGQMAVDMLNQLKTGAEKELSTEAGAVEQRLTGAIRDVGSQIAPMAKSSGFGETGQAIREGLVAGRDAVKAEQNKMRQAIAAMPGGTGKMFDSQATGLTARAQQVLDALPSPETTVNTPSGLLNQFGQPVMVTRTARVLEKQFVPDKVVARLRSLTEDKKFSLHDLIQMRSDVYEDIAAGQAVPNTGTHYLNEIGKMLTETIDKGIDQIPNPTLKKALQDANTHFKTKVLPYEESGVSSFFKRADEPGFVENIAEVKRLAGDSEKYQRVVKLLGKGSEQHEQLKRAIFDDVLQRSTDGLPQSGVIDPAALINNLKNMAKDESSRGVFQDVFGSKAAVLEDLASLVPSVRKLGQSYIDRGDVEKLITSPKASIFGLDQLVQKARQAAKIYNNQIVKEAVSGTLDPKKINPEDILNKFFPNASLSDLRQVMGTLSSDPNLMNMLRRRQIERLLKQSERELTPGDIERRAKQDLPTYIVSAEKLAQGIGSGDQRKKLEMLIGPDRLELLKHYVGVLATEEWAKAEAGGTGLLTRGSAAGGFLRMLELKHGARPLAGLGAEVSTLVQRKLIAMLLTSGALEKLTASTYTPQEIPHLLRALIVSQPFIESVFEDIPDDRSRYEVFATAKRMAGLTVDSNQQQPQQGK